jgi:O-antigen/teichoic acid export membrane protein
MFYARSWEAFHLAGLGVVLIFSIWAEPLLTTRWGGLLPASLLPPAYWEALWVIPILLFANLLMGSLVHASIWYKLQEKPDIGLLITGVGSLITVVGNLYGIPRYGYAACAVTTLLAYGGMVGVSVGLGRRKLPGAFPLRWVLLAAVGGSGMYRAGVWQLLAHPSPMHVCRRGRLGMADAYAPEKARHWGLRFYFFHAECMKCTHSAGVV